MKLGPGRGRCGARSAPALRFSTRMLRSKTSLDFFEILNILEFSKFFCIGSRGAATPYSGSHRTGGPVPLASSVLPRRGPDLGDPFSALLRKVGNSPLPGGLQGAEGRNRGPRAGRGLVGGHPWRIAKIEEAGVSLI